MFSEKTEGDVFAELASLCGSPGYAHALASFCFRDNVIKFSEAIDVQAVLSQYSSSALTRTEMSTLIGLMCKSEIDLSLPDSDTLNRYLNQTEALLSELHNSMMVGGVSLGDLKAGVDPFARGAAMREPIFYGGESAYLCQYRDLSKFKYENDNDWFLTNKGFSVEQMIDVLQGVLEFQNISLMDCLEGMRGMPTSQWTVLPGYMFTASEIAAHADLDASSVNLVLKAFSFSRSSRNGRFCSLGDFNELNAYPLIEVAPESYLLYQGYGLAEAIYETPFFWFMDDKEYKNQAMEHRGRFAENFTHARLSAVFGATNVFKNVNIVKSSNVVGEIDVLVIFAGYVVLVQAKAKKLTIEARKGNDNVLRDDFKKAVQDSYDQAFACAEFLLDEACELVTEDGGRIRFDRDIRSIYPLCVVSDHYPALGFQARQFLSFSTTEIITAPLVMDVFLADVLAEMLASPLHFLSYIRRRIQYGDRIFVSHELTALSYHLKQNMWIDEDSSMMHVGDDVCADLDVAMLVRREGLPGAATPAGVLTKFSEGTVGQLISHIENMPDACAIEFGFLLLSLSGETVDNINSGVNELRSLGVKDKKRHDLTIFIGKGRVGLTIHCSDSSDEAAAQALRAHCAKRKYIHKSDVWYGVCVSTSAEIARFILVRNDPWVYSAEMDQVVKGMPVMQRHVRLGDMHIKARKVGRNEPCICGSGKKFKKCCFGLQ